MKVYIVMAGNKYEGLVNISVHKSMDSATKQLDVLQKSSSFFYLDKSAGQYASCIETFEVEK